jgi:hypothetical protein
MMLKTPMVRIKMSMMIPFSVPQTCMGFQWLYYKKFP